MRAEHYFDVGTHPVSESGDQLRRIGPEIVLGAPDKSGARAQGENDLGRRGVERNDSRWRRTNPNRVSEVIAHEGDFAARLLTRGERECEEEATWN
jgi:hypothetical protein